MYAPTECGACDHEGHHAGEAPRLFAGLSRRPDPDKPERKEFDVPLSALMPAVPPAKEGN